MSKRKSSAGPRPRREAKRRLAVGPLGLMAGGFAGLIVLILLYHVLWGGGARPFRGNTSSYNVLLVTVDTTRADYLGCYGRGSAGTPIMDGLADGGVLFENAYTPAVMTLPSHASILTGLLPPAHHVRDNGTYRLQPEVETLAEILLAAGYRTGAAVGAVVLDSMFGLEQGFELYDDNLPEAGPHDTFFAQRPAGEVTDAALRWLGGLGPGRWFLWAHYFDPHSPYRPPRPYLAQFPDQPYEGEIAYMDAEIGRLLAGVAEMGAGSRTIVILVGDHGEGLGDHGERAHGVFLYDETARVPLIVTVPGFIEGPVRVPAVVRTTDIMPTVLDLLRLPSRSAVDGVSLWPLMSGRVEDLGLEAYAESTTQALSYGWSPMAALRAGGWKYVHAPRPELYDLVADPRESRDLYATEGARAEDLRGRLESLLAGISPAGADGGAPALSPDERARLGSLGYAGGSESFRGLLEGDPSGILSAAGRGLVDPKDRLLLLDRINQVSLAYGSGDFPRAIRMATALLESNPDNDQLRQYVADSYRQMGRWEEALSEYERLIAEDPANVNVLLNIGWVLMNMDRLDRAKAAFERALELYPGHAYAMASLGDIHFIAGEYGEAARRYREILLERPTHLKSIIGMAKTYEQQGLRREAKVAYKHAVDLSPRDLDTRLALGWLQFADREYEEALETLEGAAKIDPTMAELNLYRGDIYMALGRTDQAEEQYRQGVSKAPEAPQGYHGLGLAALQRGDVAEARRHFEEALRRDSSFTASRVELERLQGGGG